ncbi:hypothetical protein T12_11937 [Trichinella patagoniensis]|uniref:Uncharacterized protein n=1 Tax=Trichinella patagoniensis TaxID=990121 RepID=A0A0V0ZF72_9BILA|nr:hypothetical protein T12_11937 [Trichinella patagoniensis]
MTVTTKSPREKISKLSLFKIPTENQHQHTSPTATIDLQLYDLYTTTFSPTEASLRKELVGFKATTGIFIILCAATLTCAGTLLYLHAIYKRNRPVSVHYVLQKDPQHSFDST